MKSFRTVFEKTTPSISLGYDTPTLALGSCFAQHMGERLAQRKLPVLTNPTGIVFNPVSLAESLDMTTNDYAFSETDIFFDQYLWQSFRLHGQFSSVEKDEILGGGQMEAVSEQHQKMMLLAGILSLIFVPVFKMLTHLPPFMGMLLALGGLWLLSEMLHSERDHAERAYFTPASALRRIDTPSMLFFMLA